MARDYTKDSVKGLGENLNKRQLVLKIVKDFLDLEADFGVVAAYGLLLPKEILDGSRFGCLNVHASLLPRWRGAAPIQRAIMAGDPTTGVCIMRMDQGLDTGAIV